MKVAMVTPYWYPIRGGVTTYVAQLSEELRHSFGVEVVVITREGSAPGAIMVGGDSRRFTALAARELERVRPDIVHAHGHWYCLLAALRYRASHPEAKVVFTLHTEFSQPRRRNRWYLGRLLSRADFVTAVSADLLERTRRDVRFRTRTRVVRPGVSVIRPGEEEIQAFVRRNGLSGRHPILAFVGPLVYEAKARGVARAIRAMRRIAERHPGVLLVIAGDGSHRPALEGLAAREAPGLVAFLGDVPDPAPLLSAADLCVHISFQEGLPLAVLEAMACGTPVVATPVGGIPEVVVDGENGILVSGDPEELADRVSDLLGAPDLRRRLAVAAAEGAVSRLSWNKAATKFSELYWGRSPRKVVVTVDLERDYHAAADSFRGIEEGLPKLLALFEKHGVRANFFATSDLCSRYPDVLREIVRRGHILGCHGESHDVPYLSSRSYRWQVASVRRATEAIEACTGVRPRGFRAPNFSADGATIRALERLGYEYDSSVLPGRVVRKWRVRRIVDFLGAPRDPYRPARDRPDLPGTSALIEHPLTENMVSPGGPIGLGFLNAFGLDRTLQAMEKGSGSPSVFLIHPWELVEPPPGRVPTWMRTACSPDPSALDAFLGRAREAFGFGLFEDPLAESIRPPDWRQGDTLSYARPPVSVFLVTNVYAPITGGITTYVSNLARVLRGRFDVRVFAYPRILVEYEARHPRYLLRWIPHAAWSGLVPLQVLAARLRGRTVIVHSHSAAFCLLAAYAGRFFGGKAVHTFHSPIGQRSLILEEQTPRLDALVYVSAATRENYIDVCASWNGRELILPGATEIPAPVDEAERTALRATLERDLGIPASHALVLSVGRVVRDKGIHVLARAASLLAAEPVSVAVAGPPGRSAEDKLYYEGLPRLAGAAARFHLLGEVSPERLRSLYRAADVVAVPSVWAEPAPMTAIEAMAHGRPVVASRIGGLPVLVPEGRAGLLVPPEDAEALADALRRLARDSALREELARGARARAEERHSVARFGIEHARLYGSL